MPKVTMGARSDGDERLVSNWKAELLTPCPKFGSAKCAINAKSASDGIGGLYSRPNGGFLHWKALEVQQM